MANELLIIQTELHERLQKAEINYRKSPKERLTTAYIETRLQTLEELWNEFKEGHKKFISTVPKSSKETLTYFTNDVYGLFEEQYTTYKTALKSALDARAIKPTSSHALSPEAMKSSEIPLPRIQLPIFNGKYEEWQSFYDMFVSLIHDNTSLSNVQKLHYLKANVTGEPETLLRNFAITEQNYEEAWKQLVKRYNNKRYNANAILKTLFSQKTLTFASANSLKQLLDTTTSCLQSLQNIGVDTKSCDAFIVYLVVSKLDTESHKLWEQMLSSTTDLPTWVQLTEFLESRFRSIEMIDPCKQFVKSSVSNKINQFSKPKSFHSAVQEISKSSNVTCALCNGSHYIYHCQKFDQKPIKERIDFVQHKKLCFNCMCPNHVVSKCRHTTSCRRCGKKHHTMLHIEKEGSIHKESNANEGEIHIQKSDRINTETRIVANFSQGLQSHNVLLATAIINAHATNGEKYQIRALLDQGSQASFISESTVQLLNLKRIPVNGVVSGLGDGQTRIKYSVSLLLESRFNPTAKFRVNAYVLGVLTSLIPGDKLCASKWVQLEQLQLADPGYATPGKIDILLGAEVYSEILHNNMVKHPEGNLIAQHTAFGWVLSGRIQRDSLHRESIINMHIQMRSDDILRKFWEIEAEPDLIKKKLTVEEEKCEIFFSRTTTRNENGRFIVRLPFKVEDPKCQYGDTRNIAERKLIYLEKRLQKDTTLRKEYVKVMEEYLTLNHMELVPHDDLENHRATYLPHHAVVRYDKETTKVRVVMNASSQGNNGVSLNDELMIGPKLQQDLRHILMRWRTHPICIIADLVKMYRQVLVHKDDANFQRILWRSNPDMPIQHYRLITLTFGTACAPYLAIKTLQRLADEEKTKYPIAAEITKNDYYVDDLMTGCDTENEAINIYEEMNLLMNSGGFQLQKWSSNSKKLLEYIGQDKHSIETSVPIKSDNMLKVLGICWNRLTDSFEYTIDLPEIKGAVTKRQMLSDIARLYDPLGWIAPVVIRAKIIIQKVWKAQLGWDDELPEELLEEWLRYRQQLKETKAITIPRWLNCTKACRLELHAFSDASTSGYAAVVYLRVVNQFNQVYSSIVSAKTKVAPIEKELSVPRLELCGAALAAKLLSEISQVLNIPKQQLHAWTDSTIVLAWLKGGASRWTTFVSNRVSEILTILDYEQWSHVTTDMNPADCASRGLRPTELQSNTLWWHGPNWIYDVNLNRKYDEIPETEEEQKIKSMNIIQDINEEFEWTKFSNLNRMLRVISFCKRILYWKKPKEERDKLPKYITIQEMNNVLQMCIKQAQEFQFGEEIRYLKNKSCVPKKSVLHTLYPLLDQNGILRVGGRIDQAHLSYDERHPIILPSKSHLTWLLISDAHYKTLHGGPQIMLNYVRSKYWILRGRERVKKYYRTCITCRRYSNTTNTQLMGQLPKVRLTPSKPFKSSGVDYAGPINIRFSPGRGSKSFKGYICLFICMVTRAIHIEAVTDLTSKGFLAAFKRFTSRRGHCQDLYSDNGTNFVGADKLLRIMFNSAKSQFTQDIAEALALKYTNWHFIPPQAPNFGGLWEAGVRSVKSHLRKVIGESTLTYEELCTVLAEVEACVNSRPLTIFSNDPNDPLPLTPGHFLVGEPLLNVVHKDDNVVNLQDRWKLCNKMVRHFWTRWSTEYLVTLNNRYKWTTHKVEPIIGDIVILKEDNIPPAKWLLGKIVETHPGIDNIVRVVTIETQKGMFKRPCNKLCFLPKDGSI